MIGLMDRHPDFRFNQSTAQLYAYLEEDDPALFAQHQGEGRRRPVGADRRHVGRARHQHADRRVLRPPAALRPALLRADVRPAPHRLLAARLLRLLAGAAAAPAARPGVDELLHHQGELVRDQHDALRPLLVGGPRRQPRARPHLQQPGRRLQRRDRPARRSSRPGGTSAASTAIPRACSPSATATAAAARPRRCSTASASSPTSPSCRRCARPRSPTGSPRPTPPCDNDPDLPVWVGEIYLELHRGTLTTQGRDQVPAPPRRARADHRRDAVAAWRRCSARRWPPRSSRTGACCCATSSTTSCPARASARSTRRPKRSSAASSPRATASPPTQPRRHRRARRPRPATEPGVLVVNPDLSPRPLRLVSPEPLPGGQAVEGGSVLAGDAPVPGLTAAVVLDAPRRRPASAVGDRTPRERAPPRRDRRRTARSPASSTSAPAARRSPAAATRSGPMSTSRATGTPGTSRTTTPRQGEEIAAAAIEVVETRPAPRRDPRSPAASATARSCRPAALGQLRPPRLRDRHRLARAAHPAEGALPARHPLRPSPPSSARTA